MNWKQMKTNIVAWESRMVEVYPLKIILAVCMIVILWQLSSIRKEFRKELRRVDWEVSTINSEVSSIEYTVNNIESTVDDIQRNMN